MLDPTGSWTGGRFEVKAKQPNGAFLWPAIWMLPRWSSYGGWAASGEIDIMELRGQDTTTFSSTLHYGGSWPHNRYQGQDYHANTDLSAGYHVYAVEWEPSKAMRFYLDNTLAISVDLNKWWWDSSIGAPNPYSAPGQPWDKPFFMILNMAVGGNFFGGQTMPSNQGSLWKDPTFAVDYVRVYQWTDAVLTTKSVTTQAVTTQPVTTMAVSTEAVTTSPVTTMPVSTQAVTTEAVTTEAVTTEAVTTEAVSTEAVSTEAVTTEAVSTEAVTTEAVTSTTDVPVQSVATTGESEIEPATTGQPETQEVGTTGQTKTSDDGDSSSTTGTVIADATTGVPAQPSDTEPSQPDNTSPPVGDNVQQQGGREGPGSNSNGGIANLGAGKTAGIIAGCAIGAAVLALGIVYVIRNKLWEKVFKKREEPATVNVSDLIL